MTIVLQKFIADGGLCSRRKAEELIRQGKVKVNGEVAELGCRVSESDRVVVSGRRVIASNKEKIYIKLNKPVGYVCTNRRFLGEKSVFDLVDVASRLVCAGRLDKDSRGLVLLSNDGDWINKITHPSGENEKEYLVKVNFYKGNEINYKKLFKQLLEGVREGGDVLKVKKVELLDEGYFKVVLEYGKKRHVRRMFQAMGLHVKALKRVRVGNIKLGSLNEGMWEGIKVG